MRAFGGKVRTPGQSKSHSWEQVESLFKVISFSPDEYWAGEGIAALLGAALGAWVSVEKPEGAESVAFVAAALIGVIVGAVIAGMAIVTSGFDRDFIRSLDSLEDVSEEQKKISYYLSPFLYTVFLGIGASVALLVWVATLTAGVPCAISAFIGAGALAWTIGTLVSLIPALASLVDFLDIMQKSALINSGNSLKDGNGKSGPPDIY